MQEYSREPRLLDQVHAAIRARHFSWRTEKAYTGWIKRFIIFHGKRHPANLGETEVTAFLSTLATRDGVSSSTQNQALSAIIFLYRAVLGKKLEWLDGVVRAKRTARLPVVLTRDEVRAILGELRGTPWLMVSLMYGSGLRLLECARLRVKDVDFERLEITVRNGKGGKDRRTIPPLALKGAIAAHVERVRRLHERDLRRRLGSVALPDGIERKYPRAAWE
jgi:integrase